MLIGLAANVAVIVWAYRRRDWPDDVDWHGDVYDLAGTPVAYDPIMSDTPTTPDPLDPDVPADPDAPDPDDTDA